MKLTKRQLKGIIREAMKDSADYFQEGYADATRTTPPGRRYLQSDLDKDDYDAYMEGFEEGLEDRGFFGRVISKVTRNKR